MNDLQHLALLDLVAPIVRAKVSHFMATALARRRYRFLVVSAYSSASQQLELVRKGREWDKANRKYVVVDKSLVVTNAFPDETAHCVTTLDGKPAAVGIDLIPLDLEGRPLWSLPAESPIQLEARWTQTYKIPQQIVWEEIYALASKSGLDPLGDAWGKFLSWDKGHFEEPGWDVPGVLSSLDLKLGAVPPAVET